MNVINVIVEIAPYQSICRDNKDAVAMAPCELPLWFLYIRAKAKAKIFFL